MQSSFVLITRLVVQWYHGVMPSFSLTSVWMRHQGAYREFAAGIEMFASLSFPSFLAHSVSGWTQGVQVKL